MFINIPEVSIYLGYNYFVELSFDFFFVLMLYASRSHHLILQMACKGMPGDA